MNQNDIVKRALKKIEKDSKCKKNYIMVMTGPIGPTGPSGGATGPTGPVARLFKSSLYIFK